MADVLAIDQSPFQWYSMAETHLQSVVHYTNDTEFDKRYRFFWTYNAVENALLGLAAELGLAGIIDGDSGDLQDLLNKISKELATNSMSLADVGLPTVLIENFDIVRSWRYSNEPMFVFKDEKDKPILDEDVRVELIEQLEQWTQQRLQQT